MKLTSTGMAWICAVQMSAATLTLSQQGILSLDSKESVHSASITGRKTTGTGVEYSISFTAADDAGLHLVSSIHSGKGAFVGLPWVPGDVFALRFTLLSETPGAGAYVSVGAVVSAATSSCSYRPYPLGGPYDPSAVAATESDAATIKKVGFSVYIAPANADAWPRQGAKFRLLVEPAPDARVIDLPTGSEYRERLSAATASLSKSAISAFREIPSQFPSLPAARILDKAAGETGVEYKIAFPPGRGTGLLLELSSSRDAEFPRLREAARHISLRFTLVSSTAGPGSCWHALLVVNDRRTGDGVDFGCDWSGSTGTANVDIDPVVVRSVILAIGPALGWREVLAGHIESVLVEPVPGTMIAEPAGAPPQ